MTELDLRNSLLAFNKGKAFISARKVREWLGVGYNTSAECLKGLPTMDKKYFIPDVAHRVKERTVEWEE